MRLLLLPALLLLLGAKAAPASETAPAASAITLVPDKTEIAAGEYVVIRGTATLPAGASLSLLGAPPAAKQAAPQAGEAPPQPPFSILKLETGKPLAEPGRAEVPLTITAAAFELGDQTFPALDWVVNAGGKTQTLKSPPIRFKVSAPQAAAPDADIRDLKGPARPFPWPKVLGFLLVALLLAAVVAFWLWRESRERDAQGQDLPKLPPYEEALERLKQLSESGLWDSGETKEFFSQLSDIIRDYVSRRFAFDARILTTSALARHLRELEIDLAVCGAARQLLQTCDLVKFAKWAPDTSDRDQALARARELVEATKPAPEPVLTPSPQPSPPRERGSHKKP